MAEGRGPSRRLAVVTGTSSGIGESVARQLADHGWRVVGLARRPSPIDHAAYEHVVADLQDTTGLERDVAPRLAALFGERRWERVGLVNNAAHLGLLGPIERFDVPQFPGVLAVNLVAPIWFMGSVMRLAPSDAAVRIVNVSSAAAGRAIPGLGAYASSKAALRMSAMVLGAELDAERDTARRDVTVLSYEPGTVDTPMQAAARGTSAETLPSRGMFESFAANGRLVPPAAPAGEIVEYLERDGAAAFDERRYGA